MAKALTNGFRTWIEIDRRAIRRNYAVFRSRISPQTKLMAVVKSNAYGHNITEFSKELEELGADFLGVDSVVEALTLRREGIRKPILVLGFTLPENFTAAVGNDIALSLSSFDTLRALTRGTFKRPVSVHIKVDTGMHRQGFLPEEREKVVSFLKAHRKELSVDGLFTHFASAKNPSFPAYTHLQLREFEQWRQAFFRAGFTPRCHAAATAGTLLFPESHFDMVRIGIGLYGLWPAKEVEEYFSGKITLAPALSWKTVVGEVKKLPRGSKIGYDCAETLERDSTIAVCPVGYWHGYPRALSSIGHVLVAGKKCRVLGRVSMDMIIVDITDVPKAAAGSEVVLLGRSGKGEISAEYLAALQDVSWYELLTRLNPLIKRVYR